jgi:protein-arginine kinase activator protein McsA
MGYTDDDEDFDFDEFMENSDSNFKIKLEEHKERMISLAIESNYNQIAEKGISAWHLRMLDDAKLIDLKKTFDTMLDYFIDLEEYEKCTVIRDQLMVIHDIEKNRSTERI